VVDFRNLAEVDLAPSPRTTILVGENGQGKTNLLEAIYLLTTLKPLRATRLQELVRFGADRAQVAGDFDGPGGVRRAAVQVQAGGRTAYLDGKPQERLDAYFEGLAAVCFSPDDLLLVKGGPEARRRFLDRAAFNRWPAVLAEARDYVRALRARNAALRTGAPEEVEASFRVPLVRAGARLAARRQAIVAELAPRVAAAFREICGPGARARTRAPRRAPPASG
jgi:DNA replication and repair protein RecF